MKFAGGGGIEFASPIFNCLQIFVSFLLRTRKSSNNYFINFWKLQRNLKYYKSYFYLIFHWPPQWICSNVFKSFKCGENCRLDMYAPADIFGDVCPVLSFWEIRFRPGLTSCMMRSSVLSCQHRKFKSSLGFTDLAPPLKKGSNLCSLFPLEHFSRQCKKGTQDCLWSLRGLFKGSPWSLWKFCLG